MVYEATEEASHAIDKKVAMQVARDKAIKEAKDMAVW